MLNVHNLTVSFMGTDLFSGITFKLNKGDRIGLIGKNGAGKSTLLKVLSKDIESSAGTMAFDKDIQIGFLRQDIDFVAGRTIREEAYQAFEEIKSIELKLETINNQLATRTDYESEEYSQLIIDLTDLTERYELLGGYQLFLRRVTIPIILVLLLLLSYTLFSSFTNSDNATILAFGFTGLLLGPVLNLDRLLAEWLK